MSRAPGSCRHDVWRNTMCNPNGARLSPSPGTCSSRHPLAARAVVACKWWVGRGGRLGFNELTHGARQTTAASKGFDEHSAAGGRCCRGQWWSVPGGVVSSGGGGASATTLMMMLPNSWAHVRCRGWCNDDRRHCNCPGTCRCCRRRLSCYLSRGRKRPRRFMANRNG